MGVVEISAGNFHERSNFSGNFEELVDRAIGQPCFKPSVKFVSEIGFKSGFHALAPLNSIAMALFSEKSSPSRERPRISKKKPQLCHKIDVQPILEATASKD